MIIRPGGVFGRGFYVGGSTVGKVMRDLALSMIKGDPVTIDLTTYGPNEYVYGKDVGHALCLSCKAENLKQRTYNAGTGVVTGPEELAQAVRELAPKIEVKVGGARTADQSRNIPMDISVSRAELGYAPKFPLKEALQDYMDELLGRSSPIVEIPAAYHHIPLDQPLALVAALRAILADWEHSVPRRPA